MFHDPKARFPVIRHIDDVLPFIANKPEIARIQRDGYQVLDYLYADANTFDNEFARECRGLKFDAKGNLIGRPFHKFFNLNEVDETKFENQDWSNFVVMNKWDGSMIHPALVNGELVFMTRKGVTDVALKAMKECEGKYDKDKMVHLLKEGFTPIYEYVSPNNKIVLHYPEAGLINLNLRHMEEGYYQPAGSIDDPFLNEKHGIDELLAKVKTASDIEGVVIHFYGLHFSRFIKFKADDYVALHRVIDATAHEKRVLDLVMRDKIDDVLPLVAPDRATHLKNYADWVNAALLRKAGWISICINTMKDFSQKDFALNVEKDVSGPGKRFFYAARKANLTDSSAILQMMKDYLAEQFQTQAKVDYWRAWLGAPVFQMPVD